MNTYKNNARSAGILFIIGTAAGLLMLPFTGILNAPDYLTRISESGNQIAIAALLQFIMGAACAGIAISLYPALKKYNESLALGSVGFRLIEGAFQIAGMILLLVLLSLSQQFAAAGAPDASYFQTLGALLKAGCDWINNVAVLLAWCTGAFMYYYIFYQSKLVPRWLSVWGLAGILLTVAGCILVMFHIISPMGPLQVILNLPILPQEMVLAVWLIVKGFNQPALAALQSK